MADLSNKKDKPVPPLNEEANIIGPDAADNTVGTPISPEEWAEEQPLEEEPTHALEPGDPSPLQPAAGTPDAEVAPKPASRSGRDAKAKD